MVDSLPNPDLQHAIDLHRSGQTEEAEQAYRKLVTSDDNNAQAWHFLGLLLNQTGRPIEGLAMMRLAIGLSPGVPEFHTNLAAALGALGRHDEAIAASIEAIRCDPQWPTGYLNLGVGYERARRYAEAVSAYQNAIALDPNYADAYDNLGNTLRKLGRPVEASMWQGIKAR